MADSSYQHLPIPGPSTNCFITRIWIYGSSLSPTPSILQSIHNTLRWISKQRKFEEETEISQVVLNSLKFSDIPKTTEYSRVKNRWKTQWKRDEKPLDAHGEPQDVTSRQARGCVEEAVSRVVNWLIHYFQSYKSHQPSGPWDDRQSFPPWGPRRMWLSCTDHEVACSLIHSTAKTGDCK